MCLQPAVCHPGCGTTLWHYLYGGHKRQRTAFSCPLFEGELGLATPVEYGSLFSFDTVATVSCKSTPLSSFID